MEPSSPFCMRAVYGVAPRSRGLVLITAALPKSALQSAAHEGFRGIAEHWLDKLIRDRGLELPKSKGAARRSVLAKVEMIIKSIYPDISADDLKAAIMRRCESKTASEAILSRLLDTTTCTDELLEGSDGKEAKAANNEVHETKAATKQVETYVAGLTKLAAAGPGSATLEVEGTAKAAAASGSKASAAGPPKAGQQHSWPAHIAEAKGLLPKRTGVILQPYPAKRSFQVYYPNPVPPKSKTFTYAAVGNFGFSESEVLAAAVRWAWAQHTRETGEKCPFEFETMPICAKKK